ncbi:MAG: YdjY domain-containing protein [Pirellulaceae bacterium]|nr:hypothetical protein [Planctomycetales bacterium]
MQQYSREPRRWMIRNIIVFTIIFLVIVGVGINITTPAAAAELPRPGSVLIDRDKQELILSGKVQFPEGMPCINEYGERVQAFAGCATAAGGEAKMAPYFVFLIDVDTETVADGLTKLGCHYDVHYSIQDGRKRSGLKETTTHLDYLQGDPVVLSVFWQGESGKWVERPYEYFVTEKVKGGDREIEKPWTPHFVFHGSGAIHKSGTGCIACPCDCPGGIIADNRNPIYDPKPLVRFDMSKAPPVGTQIYVRIRPITTRTE